MAKFNWDNTRVQNNSRKYGVEIDFTVGEDPNKNPKHRNQKNKKTSKIKSKVKPVFVPKTIILSKEEKLKRLSVKLINFMEHLQYETQVIDNKSKCDATRTYNDFIKKLAVLNVDEQTRKVITDARHAINRYCSRPNTIQGLTTATDYSPICNICKIRMKCVYINNQIAQEYVCSNCGKRRKNK